MNKTTRKTHLFEVDQVARQTRRNKPRKVKQSYTVQRNGERTTRHHEYETTADDCETRQALAEAARSFISTIEFYKSEFGGKKPHDEAVNEALQNHEWRRSYVDSLSLPEITWGHL